MKKETNQENQEKEVDLSQTENVAQLKKCCTLKEKLRDFSFQDLQL